MRSIVSILIFILFSLVGYSQTIVRTSGEGSSDLTNEKSRMDVMAEAKERAIIDALERAFGRVIVQGNSTYLSNVNTGEKTETNTVFNMIANTSVKGEVVELIDERYTDLQGHNQSITIRCNITIKAKEITSTPIEFTASTTKCPDKNCTTTSFIEGEDFFIYFNTPVSGYLTIYLDDGKNAQSLLPYIQMPTQYESGFPVYADKEYIFFSKRPEHYYPLEVDYLIDEYQLYAEKKEDLNRIFIIFSKTPLNKPKLKEDLMDQKLSEVEKELGFIMPKSTDSEDFQRWLIKNRGYRAIDLQVQVIDISITK